MCAKGYWFILCRNCRKYNQEYLVNLIKKYIKPGKTIYGDQWADWITEGWNLSNIKSFNYIHKTVNHKLEFIEKFTGVRTTTIEGFF